MRQTRSWAGTHPAGILIVSERPAENEPVLRAFVWGARRLRPLPWPSGWKKSRAVTGRDEGQYGGE